MSTLFCGNSIVKPEFDFPGARYAVVAASCFRKDFKRAVKQGRNLQKFAAVVGRLAQGLPLPAANRDHQLSGKFAHARECHIEPDWLLVYQIDNGELILTLMRTGTHAELGLA